MPPTSALGGRAASNSGRKPYVSLCANYNYPNNTGQLKPVSTPGPEIPTVYKSGLGLPAGRAVCANTPPRPRRVPPPARISPPEIVCWWMHTLLLITSRHHATPLTCSRYVFSDVPRAVVGGAGAGGCALGGPWVRLGHVGGRERPGPACVCPRAHAYRTPRALTATCHATWSASRDSHSLPY